MSAILANSSASASGGMGMFGMIIWLVVIFGFMYFLMIRPQKKEQKKKDLMLSEVAVGDTVLTTSGFYGTIIDIVVRSIGVYISKMGKKYKSSLQKIMYNYLCFDENNGKSKVTLDKYGKK